jgi:hypothetical protein
MTPRPMSSVGNPRRNARKRNPPATRRRALELLAASRDGATEALLVAHGFTIDFLVELIHAGLETAKSERVVAAGRIDRPPQLHQRVFHIDDLVKP